MHISTNGSLRDENFWFRISKYFPKDGKSYISFAIDGLEFTNPIYRVGSDWNKIISNVKAFNQNGKAYWKYVLFEHNQKDVEEAKKLSKELKFLKFTEVISGRFREYKSVKNLKPPKDINIKNKENNKIICNRQKKKSVHISYEGLLFPCCWTSLNFYKKKEDFSKWDKEKFKKIKEELSLENKTIYDIMKNSSFFNNDVIKSWESEKPFYTCVDRCKHNKLNIKIKS